MDVCFLRPRRSDTDISKLKLLFLIDIAADIYMFKVNNAHTR